MGCKASLTSKPRESTPFPKSLAIDFRDHDFRKNLPLARPN
jgi:hypothetical protein